MSATNHSQQPVTLPSDETSLPHPPLPVLIPRSAIVEHRVKGWATGLDIDSNKLSTTIKRSQAISNIQDLDEDSPVTFEIAPNDHHHHHVRKKVQLQNTLMSYGLSNESIPSISKQQTTSSGGGDESDTRSESSEKMPEYIEEERPILPGIHVKGATFNRLIRILIDSFEPNGHVIDDSEYPRVFFLMHKWIMASEYLSNMLYDLYKHYADDYKKAINTHEKRQHKDCQLRVCHAYSYWMKNFPMHFDDGDERLIESCGKLQNLLESSGDADFMNLVNLSQVPSFEWMRQMTVRNQVKTPMVSLSFNDMEPQTLAAQLTYLEWKVLRKITFTNYKTYAIKNTLQDNPRLERSIQFFNGLSTWIQCMVLNKTTPQERAEIIHKFLDVAKHLKVLQNFNTCLAVIGGISHSALARLSKTMTCLSTADIRFLGEMTDLLSSNSNYAQYRKSLSECEGFKIPIIGVHLKDIICLHVALQDRLEYDLINFRKLAQLSVTFRTLTNLQVSLPPVQPNNHLIKLLTLSFDIRYTEDEIYELSLTREPRSSVSSPDQVSRGLHSGDTSSDPVADGYKKKEQVHSPVFADWAAGVSQTIDIQTIQRHVNAMIEAVFTTYDHDRDGYISHTEFEEIAQHFPFIDTFAVLDADQDGMISKTEMRCYFLRAKYHDLKGEFKHDFHETTYFKPTFCVHCTGLLWGVIKQGWKCKDCGINAHRLCKDQVVMECRPKRQHTVNKQGSVTDSRPSRGSFRTRKARKQKSTQTEDLNFSSSSSASSESCTSSSEDEHPPLKPPQVPVDKSSHNYSWHLRRPPSLKRRKQISSDSNDDYYTHSPSPQQASSLTTITTTTTTTTNSSTSTNTIPALQLIPRGPLICSDNFEKWNDRSFTWNRPLPPAVLLSSVSSSSAATSESALPKDTVNDRATEQPSDGHGSFLEGDVSDDDTCFTSQETEKNLQQQQWKTNTSYSSSQNLNARKLSVTGSLRSLPNPSEQAQQEIFERLRQAEEEKKRLELENRAMKQELVRTKSKISSLKREMSSIQQLHMAQQQVHAQLSAPTMISARHELSQRSHSQNPSSLSPVSSHAKERSDQQIRHAHRHQQIAIDMKNLSTSSNEESLSPPPPHLSSSSTANNTSCSTQTLPFTTTATSDPPTRPSIAQPDSSISPSDEQLRLYLNETLQREKDSAV